MISLLVLAAFLLDGSDARQEPVVGLPCEGCELVMDGMPEVLTLEGRIAPAGEPGEPLTVDGTVYDADGSPAPGIIVYAYQTDANGIYPRGPTGHGRLRGWAKTDADGRYRFTTIRPGAYPGRDIPQHIHLHILEPGNVTYYIDDITFTDDPLLPDTERTRTTCRGGCGVSEPWRDGDGTWRVRRDIVLGLEIPGYE